MKTLSWGSLLVGLGGLAVAIGHGMSSGFDSVSMTAIGTAIVTAINALFLRPIVPPSPIQVTVVPPPSKL